MRLFHRTAKLRVGVAADLAGAAADTGHGTVWHSVLRELRSIPSVRLVTGGRADVWLSSATSAPPDGGPLVVQVHEVGWHDAVLRSFLEPRFAEHMEALTANALAAASLVITPSEASRAQVIDAYAWAPDRVRAIPHGVDHHRFRPGLSGGQARIGAPYVLFVGVLHPRKNLGAVRSAMARLVADGMPHVLAAVANSPPDRAEPPDLESQLQLDEMPGRVRLLRRVSERDLAVLMAGAEAFCLPSFFEGFGLPALEAMACGAPVIVSDRGALPEVVGAAGLIVDTDPAAVEEGLRRVLTDTQLARRLRDDGIQRAAQFDWRKTAEGWLEVLRMAA